MALADPETHSHHLDWLLGLSIQDNAFHPKLCCHTIPAFNLIRQVSIVGVGRPLLPYRKSGHLAYFPFIHMVPGDGSFAIHMYAKSA